MSWHENKVVYLISISVSLVIGFVAGLYPALYSTSFQPALALKSSYALSPMGRITRKILVAFQFFISFISIISAIFVQIQHNHMTDFDGGYIKDGIVHITHGARFDKGEILKEKLMANPEIQDVTFSYFPFASVDASSLLTLKTRTATSEFTSFHILPVADNFLSFFDITILEGRDFITSDNNTANGCYVMSKETMDLYEFSLDKKTNSVNGSADIVGVCDNISLANLSTTKAPFAFYNFGKSPWDYNADTYIKISGNSGDIIQFIRDCYKDVAPERYIDINFLTSELENAYPEESRTKNIVSGFSLIAVIIALVGVFGLVSFDTRFRRREIAIRRVHGATINEILRMFGSAYIKIVLVSFALAVPIVWYAVDNWLQRFPYRIDITWWVFALSLFMVLLLTITISTIQTFKAANENPIDTIKTQI